MLGQRRNGYQGLPQARLGLHVQLVPVGLDAQIPLRGVEQHRRHVGDEERGRGFDGDIHGRRLGHLPAGGVPGHVRMDAHLQDGVHRRPEPREEDEVAETGLHGTSAVCPRLLGPLVEELEHGDDTARLGRRLGDADELPMGRGVEEGRPELVGLPLLTDSAMLPGANRLRFQDRLDPVARRGALGEEGCGIPVRERGVGEQRLPLHRAERLLHVLPQRRLGPVRGGQGRLSLGFQHPAALRGAKDRPQGAGPLGHASQAGGRRLQQAVGEHGRLALAEGPSRHVSVARLLAPGQARLGGQSRPRPQRGEDALQVDLVDAHARKIHHGRPGPASRITCRGGGRARRARSTSLPPPSSATRPALRRPRAWTSRRRSGTRPRGPSVRPARPVR